MPTATDREAVWNRRLRRADWHVLLPDPRPARTLCFARGRLAAAVAAVFDTVVRPPVEGHDAVDLTVAVNPTRRTLEAAASALRPGGSLYSEWYVPRAGSPDAVRRRLAAAGFDDVRCYWPWPPPWWSSPSFWLPLEGPGALDYLMRRGSPSPSPLRRAARAVQRLVWRLAHRCQVLVPVCAVAVKQAGAAAGAPGVDPPSGDRRPPSRGVVEGGQSMLLLTGGPRSVSKIVGLVFDEPDPRPRLAVKFARTPEARRLLRREAAVLEALAASAPTLEGLPRVVHTTDREGFFAVAESAVPSTALFTIMDDQSYARLASDATAWLAALAGRRPPTVADCWWGRLVGPVIDDFGTQFGPVLEHAELDIAVRALRTLGPLPLVCEHRDFSPWNVLVDRRGRLSVVDWEGAELDGLPGLDLLYFLTYHAFFLRGTVDAGAFRETYRACFDPSTSIGGVTADCLRLYSERVGVAPEAWAPLRLFLWMLKSRSEYGRFAEDAAGPPTAALLRGSVFLTLWREEVRVAGQTMRDRPRPASGGPATIDAPARERR